MKIFGLEIKIPRILMPIERRKAERFRAYETVYLDYRSPGEEKFGSGEGRDISTRGIRFACPSYIPKGTFLNLTLRFAPDYASSRKTIHLRAYVVRAYRQPRQKRFRVACAFENVDAPTHKELEDFVLWLKDRKDQYLYY